jgi:hypothetical protein
MDDEEEVATYVRHQILAWSVKHAPNLESAKLALERSGVSASVDEVLGPHPDLLSWSSGVRIGPRFPMSEAEFHSRVESDINGLIGELMTFKVAEPTVDGSTWYDITSLVDASVAAKPADGLALLSQPGLDDGLVSAVLRGWQRAQLEALFIEQVVEVISTLELPPVVDDVARLLTDGNSGGTKVSEWHRSGRARVLARRVWAVSAAEVPESPPDRWLDSAVNTTAGRIALFWVRTVSADWTAQPDDWGGLSDETKSAFDDLLGEDASRSAMAEVVVASQIHFLFRADREFAVEVVLPLLQWNNSTRAVRAWDGFLVWGRWEDALLDAGLFEAYQGAINAWSSLSERQREGLCSHLAAIAIYSARDPITWLSHFISEAPPEGRIEWAREVGRLLSQVSDETVEHEWNRWIDRYWTQRLASVPRALEIGEASEMATWIPYLSDSIEAAVELAQRGPLELGERNDLLRLLDDQRFDRAPAAFIRLLVHALTDTEMPYFAGYHLKGIVGRARAVFTPDDLSPILEAAMRIGYSDAYSWLLPDQEDG